MKVKRPTVDDRRALKQWEELKAAIMSSSEISPDDSRAVIEARRKRLEAAPEAWFEYYFSMYCTCPPADFHKEATKRILLNNRWYEVRAWARELAKSARSMMEIIFLALTGIIRNVLLISSTLDNAVRLLAPFMASFEANARIKQDYGQQQNPGKWEEAEFTLLSGCAFRAIGAGQSPRGTRNKQIRPDFILVDDIDTDEECRNPERIKVKWEWLENALLPTMSVSGNYRILFNGNIIAKDCCITRARDKAASITIGHFSKINIRDENGNSTWPQKNSESDIDLFLSLISTSAGQKEFYNNPVSEGKVFKNLILGKIPPLSKFKYLVIYGDPATGESKSKSKKGSFKAVWLLGKRNGKLYIIKGFLDRALQADFIMWYPQLIDFVNKKTSVYCYMENNSLQDPFFQKVFKPLVNKIKRKLGRSFSIKPDTEKKTDKPSRIEANLEPLDRDGEMIFNEEEKDNPHLIRLIDQFKMFEEHLPYPADGPDCIEGGNRILDNRLCESESIIQIARRQMREYGRNRL